MGGPGLKSATPIPAGEARDEGRDPAPEERRQADVEFTPPRGAPSTRPASRHELPVDERGESRFGTELYGTSLDRDGNPEDLL